MRCRKLISAFLILLLPVMTGCGINGKNSGKNEISNGGYISRTGFYFDTVISVSIYSDNDEKLLDNCMTLCERYENIFSPTAENSELYRLNLLMQKPENTGNYLEISKELYEVLNYVLPYCSLTDGKYDPTIRNVSELWDFQSETAVPPSAELIEERLRLVDYRNINVFSKDTLGHIKYYLSTEKAGVQLDLGSVAKGYIADCLDEYLRERGVTSAVISLGGNIQCIGEKPTGDGASEPFKIGISSPYKNDDSIYKTVDGKDNSIVTSGVYMRSFEYNGLLYHHILDANTGYPENNGLLSVTIITDSGMKADLLSTVCFLAGYDKSVSILSQIENTYAEFVYNDNSVKTID